VKNDVARGGNYYLAQRFNTVQMDSFQVLARTRCENERCLADMARVLGVDGVLSGTVTGTNAGYEVSLRLARRDGTSSPANPATYRYSTTPQANESQAGTTQPPTAGSVPPLGGRAIGAFFAGFAAAPVAALGAGIISIPLLIGDAPGVFFVVPIAIVPTAVAVTVYKIGETQTETGSFAATLFGASVGLAAGAAVGFHSESIWPAWFACPALAVVGFNMTRRYKVPAAPAPALLYREEGRVSLGLPRVQYRMHPVDHTVTRNLGLVRVRF
jgi:hypothetical protein